MFTCPLKLDAPHARASARTTLSTNKTRVYVMFKTRFGSMGLLEEPKMSYGRP